MTGKADSSTARDPKVTVVVSTYNHVRYIAEALESVLAQETSFPFEVVVVEDCSTDGTQRVLRGFRDRRPETVHLLLGDKNQNDNRAWGRAVIEAKGTYVALLDGDDYWTSPFKLATQVAYLDRHPACSICFHNARIVYSDTRQPDAHHNSQGQNPISSIEDLWARNFMATSSVMLRGRLVSELPEWYVTMRIGDWPFYLLYAERGGIGYIPETMSVYRRHGGGVFGGLSDVEQLRAILQFYEEMRPRYEQRYGRAIRNGVVRHQCLLIRKHLETGDPEAARTMLKALLTAEPSVLREQWREAAGLTVRVVLALLRRRVVSTVAAVRGEK